MGQAITLTDEHLELLSRPSLTRGNGGHQNYFRILADQRNGNRQSLSLVQVKQARERLEAIESEGTWQEAYSAVLSYFPGY